MTHERVEPPASRPRGPTSTAGPSERTGGVSAIPRLRDSGADDALARDDPAAVEGLRGVLDGAGYTHEAVGEALGVDSVERDPFEVSVHLRALGEREDPLATLIRLFRLGVPVSLDAAARAVAPVPVERLEAIGLLEVEGDEVAARLSLLPVPELIGPAGPELIVPADWEQEGQLPTHPGHVVGVSAGSRLLARLVPRRPVERALDLGAAGGVQALLLARHARRVTATDLNPRALRFARFGCRLNGAENVELREGSMLEPVRGERFDIVASNPPYVVSPDAEYVFRDSGLPGDALCEALVREVPTQLTDGGLAVLMVSWVHAAGEEPAAPLRRWLADGGCDALILHFDSSDALSYAAAWYGRREAGEFARGLERWMAYYAERGIERIGLGALVLRRRDGPNWTWVHTPLAPARQLGGEAVEPGRAGDHVLRLIAAQDLLAAGEEALLAATLVPAPDHLLEQTARLHDGASQVQSTRLRLEGGLGIQVSVEPAVAGLLARLDGARPLGEVIADVARGLAPAGSSPGPVDEALLAATRRLVELGFAVPAGAG